jgi:hypothetical protein
MLFGSIRLVDGLAREPGGVARVAVITSQMAWWMTAGACWGNMWPAPGTQRWAAPGITAHPAAATGAVPNGLKLLSAAIVAEIAAAVVTDEALVGGRAGAFSRAVATPGFPALGAALLVAF